LESEIPTDLPLILALSKQAVRQFEKNGFIVILSPSPIVILNPSALNGPQGKLHEGEVKNLVVHTQDKLHEESNGINELQKEILRLTSQNDNCRTASKERRT
jgi:hypothetical protein